MFTIIMDMGNLEIIPSFHRRFSPILTLIRCKFLAVLAFLVIFEARATVNKALIQAADPSRPITTAMFGKAETLMSGSTAVMARNDIYKALIVEGFSVKQISGLIDSGYYGAAYKSADFLSNALTPNSNLAAFKNGSTFIASFGPDNGFIAIPSGEGTKYVNGSTAGKFVVGHGGEHMIASGLMKDLGLVKNLSNTWACTLQVLNGELYVAGRSDSVNSILRGTTDGVPDSLPLVQFSRAFAKHFGLTLNSVFPEGKNFPVSTRGEGYAHTTPAERAYNYQNGRYIWTKDNTGYISTPAQAPAPVPASKHNTLLDAASAHAESNMLRNQIAVAEEVITRIEDTSFVQTPDNKTIVKLGATEFFLNEPFVVPGETGPQRQGRLKGKTLSTMGSLRDHSLATLGKTNSIISKAGVTQFTTLEASANRGLFAAVFQDQLDYAVRNPVTTSTSGGTNTFNYTSTKPAITTVTDGPINANGSPRNSFNPNGMRPATAMGIVGIIVGIMDVGLINALGAAEMAAATTDAKKAEAIAKSLNATANSIKYGLTFAVAIYAGKLFVAVTPTVLSIGTKAGLITGATAMKSYLGVTGTAASAGAAITAAAPFLITAGVLVIGWQVWKSRDHLPKDAKAWDDYLTKVVEVGFDDLEGMTLADAWNKFLNGKLFVDPENSNKGIAAAARAADPEGTAARNDDAEEFHENADSAAATGQPGKSKTPLVDIPRPVYRNDIMELPSPNGGPPVSIPTYHHEPTGGLPPLQVTPSVGGNSGATVNTPVAQQPNPPPSSSPVAQQTNYIFRGLFVAKGYKADGSPNFEWVPADNISDAVRVTYATQIINAYEMNGKGVKVIFKSSPTPGINPKTGKMYEGGSGSATQLDGGKLTSDGAVVPDYDQVEAGDWVRDDLVVEQTGSAANVVFPTVKRGEVIQ